MPDQIVHVTDASFEGEVLKSDRPVLVDFWAVWCGPCQVIAPLLEEVAGDYGGRLKVAKINVDENQATSAAYGVRSIPTLMLFKDGDGAGTKVGAMSKPQLTAFVDAHL
ncbi:thioredoxin TrxA [Streptomyces rubrogriseus]|uniref:thioredoxin TrxA n=1 Tax=Streptomyces rubrogriseus TaxID=194673 RepID=UPI000D5A18AB|nr:thioredoxin TrxA [Streptomyces rubrogriseus]